MQRSPVREVAAGDSTPARAQDPRAFCDGDAHGEVAAYSSSSPTPSSVSKGPWEAIRSSSGNRSPSSSCLVPWSPELPSTPPRSSPP